MNQDDGGVIYSNNNSSDNKLKEYLDAIQTVLAASLDAAARALGSRLVSKCNNFNFGIGILPIRQ